MTRERAKSLPDDDWRSRDPEFNEPKLSKNLILVERLARDGKAPRAVSGERLRLPGRYASGSDRGNCGDAQPQTGGRCDRRG